MCPQKQIDPKPKVPTLILEAKSWNMVRNSPKGKLEPVLQRKELQLLGSLQYCRKRENYNCCDRSSIANRKKLQLLQLLQYCRERNCNYYDLCSTAERGN